MDLTGQRYGRLIVIKEAPPQISAKGQKRTMWYCNCDCGTQMKIVAARHLRSGGIISCGCYQKESRYERHKENKYDLTNSFGKGYTAKGEEFLFDLEDYDLIKDYCWHVHNGYVVAYNREKNNKKIIRMHRLVMRYEGLLDVDHIVTERKLDNRKSNLRLATRSQNNRNHKPHKNNSSGCPGVSWDKKHNKWESSITVNYKKKFLGFYEDFDEAIKVRKEAENRLFGEWSYDNSQKISKNLKEVI